MFDLYFNLNPKKYVFFIFEQLLIYKNVFPYV